MKRQEGGVELMRRMGMRRDSYGYRMWYRGAECVCVRVPGHVSGSSHGRPRRWMTGARDVRCRSNVVRLDGHIHRSQLDLVVDQPFLKLRAQLYEHALS